MGQTVTGHYKLLFPSKYLSSADLKERDVTVLIDRVEKAALRMSGGKSETRVLIFFKTAKGQPLSKSLVANKTNATTIASLHGTKVEKWIGKPITLFPTTCKFGPTTVDCIRIRARTGKPTGDVHEELTQEQPEEAAPEDDFADIAGGPEDSPAEAQARALADVKREPGEEGLPMAEGMNRVFLLGNLCADPEYRTTSGGTGVLKLRMATNERYLDKDKAWQERTEYHSVTVWGKRGEALSRFLTKGSSVFVEGSLRTSSYEKDGEKRYKTEIVASNVLLTGGKRDGGGREDGAPPRPRAEPRGYGPSAGEPAGGGTDDGFGGDDSDLPFVSSRDNTLDIVATPRRRARGL